MKLETLLCDVLKAFPDVRLAVLFGSAARGDPSGEGDIDLGVVLNHGAPARTFTDLEIALGRSVGRASRRPIDLVDLSRAPPLLRFEVARDGVVLVELERFAWADFKARAMIDWWDWAPTARAIQKRVRERLERQVGDGSP
jgi:predicted nucleotidyltransferase